MKCKDCQHWGKETVAQTDNVSFNTYGIRHYCHLLSSNDDTVSDDNDAESVAHGVGGAAIATGPNFGCIHFLENSTIPIQNNE